MLFQETPEVLFRLLLELLRLTPELGKQNWLASLVLPPCLKMATHNTNAVFVTPTYLKLTLARPGSFP